jgi:hypothetical protein
MTQRGLVERGQRRGRMVLEPYGRTWPLCAPGRSRPPPVSSTSSRSPTLSSTASKPSTAARIGAARVWAWVQELAQLDLAWASGNVPAGQLWLHTEGHAARRAAVQRRHVLILVSAGL